MFGRFLVNEHPGLTNHALEPTLAVSTRWRTADDEWRMAQVRSRLAEASGIPRFMVVRVTEREIVVRLDQRMPPREYGRVLMQLERWFRAALGEPVELYREFMADRNGPRREIQARIADWRRRREESRIANLTVAKEENGRSA